VPRLAHLAAPALGLLAVVPVAAAEPTLSLSVSPGRLIIPGRGQATLQVTNTADAAATIDVRLADYIFTPLGKAILDPKLPPARSAKSWLTPSTTRLTLGAHQTGAVDLVSRPPHNATPGDHQAVLLFATGGTGTGQVQVRTQIGVGVMVRVGGTLRRDLLVHNLTVHRGGRVLSLRLGVSNRGNVDERMLQGQVRVELKRNGRTFATLVSKPRSILPGTSGIIAFPYRGTVRGEVTAVARLVPTPAAQAGPGIASTPPAIVRQATVRL